jgi:hypothetical protein
VTDAYGVALDTKHAYWASVSTSTGGVEIQSALLTGGAVNVLGQTVMPFYAGGMALGANGTLFFAAFQPGGGGGIFQLPISGGTPTSVWVAPASGQPVGVAVDNKNVYWVDKGAGLVLGMPITGGTVGTLATGIGEPTDIASDGTHIFFTAFTGDAVYEEPVGGGTPTVLTNVTAPVGIAADNTDNYVYFTAGDAVYAYPKK